MTNKFLVFIFIEIFVHFWTSIVAMSISESVNKCAEFRQRCNPNAPQPCCNSNEVCTSKISDQLDIYNYICLKKGVLYSSCKRFMDCEAIIGGKCSENGHCVCRKQTVEYNETICLFNSLTDRLTDELMDNYYDFNGIYYLKNNFSSKTGCQRVSNTNYGEFCTSDLQCLQNNHKNLRCINRECRCPNGTQFILDSLTCKSSLRGVGKSCLLNRKCLVENSYCNRFGTCKCKVNYYYTSADKCELSKPKQNCSRSNLGSLTDKTSYKQAQKPNDSCLTNADCMNVKYTSCQSRVCKCLKNYYVSEKTENCTRYAKQPNDRCIDDRGCRRIDNSRCELEKCQCFQNFPLNPSTNKCEPILGRKCTENSECDALKNLICSRGKCVCNVNFFEKNGICLAGINKACKELEECFVENSVCEDNKCRCSNNFYATKNESLCIPKAKSLNDYCDEDENCEALDNTGCFEKKCKCRSAFMEKEGKCRPLNYCDSKSDCKKPKHSICRNHKCVCSSNKYLSSNNAKCNSFAKSIGSACESDKKCERLKNSKCNEEKKCSCIENYLEVDNQCKGIIDAGCLENSDCADNNSICESNICKCSQNFYPSMDKRECRKYADHINEACEENDDCVRIKNSKCSEHDKCVCKMNYFEKEGECKTLLGVNCTENFECGANNSRCDLGSCICSDGFFSSGNKQECIEYAINLNDYCESDNYCENLRYTHCRDQKCVCVENYTNVNGKCRGLFGENCLEDLDCVVNNSKCEENICRCPADYYLSENKERCYRYAKEILDFCESEIGCKNLNFSVCTKNKQCECSLNYMAIKGLCRGLIDSNCSEDLDCGIENSICDSGTCQCGPRFYLSENRDRCYQYAEELDSFCESSIGCRDLNYSFCSGNKCVCLENYAMIDDRCRGFIDAGCADDSDCALENSICKAGSCQCDSDFYLSENRIKCYPYARKLGDFCESGIACRDLEYADCSGNNQCDCLSNYTVVEGHCRALIGSNCSGDSDCATNNSICKASSCRCPVNSYLSTDTSTCHPLAKQINDFCETDFACHDLKFTYCSIVNKCTCLPTHIVKIGRCRGLISAKCLKDSDCVTENSICASNTCQCPNNSYLSHDANRCYPFAKHLNDFCETDVACRDLKFASCSKNNKCVCGQTYLEINGFCRGSIGSTCFENYDCAAINSICDDSKTCQCSSEFYLSSSKSECYLFAIKHNDFCEIDFGCRYLKHTHCSEDQRCVCLQNFQEIDGHCRGLIGVKCSADSDCAVVDSVCDDLRTCQCPAEFYLSKNENKCHPYAKKLYDFCENDIGCYNLNFSTCFEGKCICSRSYTEIDGVCRGFIGAKCHGSSDCSVRGSICESLLCECPGDFYLSEDQNQCYQYARNLYDFCESDKSCRNIKFTHCIDEKCACEMNYIETNGSCLGLIGSKCSDDFECAADYSICNQKSCQCSVNFYSSENNQKCYKYAEKLGDECEVKAGCQNLNFTFCSDNYECLCSETYIEINGKCRGLHDAKCVDNLDCAADNSICDESNTCQCPDDSYLSLDRRKCYSFARKLSDFCESDGSCRELKFTKCSGSQKCICNEGYIEVDGICRGFIGANCSENLDCAVENSVCQSGRCLCPNDFYLSENSSKCYLYAKQLNAFCETDISCRNFKYSYCSENSICACSENYTVIDGFCRGLIEAACSDDFDCAVENSLCEADSCQCPNDSYLSINKRKCHPYAKELGGFCESSIGCRDLNYSFCSGNKCVCLENYAMIDDRCRGFIDAGCTDDSDCALENSICKAGSCQCDSDFYLSENRIKCYPYARKLGDFCESGIACRDLEYADCFGNNQCDCLSNYTVVEGHCRALIGSNCSGDSDCATNNSICKASSCRCPVNSYLSTDTSTCHPLAKQINDFCEIEAGCHDLQFTYCSVENECVCLPNYTKIGESCRGFIHANCFGDSDCVAENSVCKSNSCQCPSDFYLSLDGTKCHPFAKQIGDFCDTDDSCRDLEFTFCSESNQCTCLPNFKQVNKNCRGFIGSKCFNDSNCALMNSVCQSNSCQCQNGFYFSKIKSSCHKYANLFGDFCEDDNACRNISHTGCSTDHRCVCSRDYVLIDNHCRGFIGSDCSEDSDCAFEYSFCDQKICQCREDFYKSINGQRCYAYAERINEFCDSDMGCRFLNFSICSKNNKCVCSPNYIPVEDNCRGISGAKCSKDQDCALNNSTCADNICNCLPDFYLSETEEKCHQYAKQLDDFCETDDACRDLKYTHCSEKKCTCLPNYHAKNGFCRGLVGSNCSETSDCFLSSSVCKSDVCQCPDEFYLSTKLQKCIPFAKRLYDFCEANSSCGNIKFTFCSKNSECICLPDYLEESGSCRGLIDQNCIENSDCAVENSICDSSVCQCLSGLYPSANRENCSKYATNLNDYCEDNEGCRKVKHSFCSDDKNCTCFSSYKDYSGQCLGVFNASCDDDSDCSSFYQCVSNRCLCRDGFAFDDYFKCVSVNRYLGESCTDDYCRNIEHSSCDRDFRCACATDYLNVNRSCLDYLGSCCFKDSDCGVKNSVCKGYYCQCEKNFFFHPFYLECRKK